MFKLLVYVKVKIFKVDNLIGVLFIVFLIVF